MRIEYLYIEYLYARLWASAASLYDHALSGYHSGRYQILLAWRGRSVVDIYPDWGILGKCPQLRASDMRQGAGIAPSSGRLSLSFGRKRHSAGLRLKVLVCRTWLIKK
jgi:hypothetical protein